MSVLCSGKKVIPLLQGAYLPLVVEVSFPGDLTNPPPGHSYAVWVKVTKPDKSEFMITDSEIERIGPSTVRFWVDARDGGTFHDIGFYGFRVYVSELDESDEEVQVWGAEADACLYVYEQSPCPEGPCDG